MAKTATVTKTKTATKAANDKTKSKPSKDDKPKREPTAYNLFCKANMKTWNDANPGRAKEAMGQMAILWKDAPENPNRGGEAKARKPRAPKAVADKDAPATKSKSASKAAPKAAAKSSAKPSKAATKVKKRKAQSDDEDEDDSEGDEKENQGAPSSDAMEGSDEVDEGSDD